MSKTILDLIGIIGSPGVYVDNAIKETDGFLTVETIVVGARQTPAVNSRGGTLGDFTAIGIAQTASVAQKKDLQQLFEIGSNTLYTIPGRPTISATISRIMIDGDSLLRVLYGSAEIDSMDEIAGFDVSNGSILVNLASEFFNNPCDLMFALFNAGGDFLGAFYLESAVCFSHALGLAAQSTIVTEEVALMGSRIVSLSLG